MSLVIPLDPRVNPSYLKLDLYCRGARLHESCFSEKEGGRPILRTRAGLGSGLEVILPGELWTNVPVTEPFAKASPYEFRPGPPERQGEWELMLEGRHCAWVRLAPCPAWYERKTSTGKPMKKVGTLQGTYLGIYPAKVCEFWLKGPGRPARENCRFCSVGLNLGVDDAPGKSVDEVLEVVHAAWRESGITYVDFNTGHDDEFDFLDVLEPYIRRIKRETRLFVGVQTPPFPALSRYLALKALGVNRVSFCFEIFDPPTFERVCPGKARVYGLHRYLEAVEYCASLSDFDRFTLDPWVANGEIIAGLEPPESSIAAIEWLTARKAIPTVCVFRPLSGTDMALDAPPDTDDMVPVFRALYEECMKRELPIGMAPNIHVSLVPLPEECRWLVQDPAAMERYARQERVLALKRRAFAAALRARRLFLGPRPRRAVA